MKGQLLSMISRGLPSNQDATADLVDGQVPDAAMGRFRRTRDSTCSVRDSIVVPS